MSTEAQDRFEAILREQARAADGISAIASTKQADRATWAGDALRDAAENFRVKMAPEQLDALEHMSDDGMRVLATLGRWMAGWIEERKRGDG